MTGPICIFNKLRMETYAWYVTGYTIRETTGLTIQLLAALETEIDPFDSEIEGKLLYCRLFGGYILFADYLSYILSNLVLRKSAHLF